MKRFWKLLNSRKLAIYLLLILVLFLIFSTLLPSPITVSEEDWAEIQQEKPFIHWLSTTFGTPYVVKSYIFLIPSFFLFLSTFACTLTRVLRWARTRKAEFEKEQAFSFSVEEQVGDSMEGVKEKLLQSLKKKNWDCSVFPGEKGMIMEGQKGSDTGFWGSIVFHIGLIICFIGAPVSALTVFRGEFLVTEGVTLPLKAGFISHEGKDISTLPDVDVTVLSIEGEYAEGKYKVHFGGTMRINERDIPFEVNQPVEWGGYEIIMHTFGHAPGVIIERDGEPLFDYFLNLRHRISGDYFDLPFDGLTLYVLFFPDFHREGKKIMSRSEDVNNPVIMVKFMRGDEEIAKGLIPVGEDAQVGEYRVFFHELRNWSSFVVVKEWGLTVLAIGMVIGLLGLLFRFLSNERSLEVTIREGAGGAEVTLRGYSRYYPAFLEREVRMTADRLKES
jgi:cytochrome c biogenesis protein